MAEFQGCFVEIPYLEDALLVTCCIVDSHIFEYFRIFNEGHKRDRFTHALASFDGIPLGTAGKVCQKPSTSNTVTPTTAW